MLLLNSQTRSMVYWLENIHILMPVMEDLCNTTTIFVHLHIPSLIFHTHVNVTDTPLNLYTKTYMHL